MTLDRFYPVFDSSDWLTRLLPLGIKLLQLRLKDKTDADIRSEIRMAKDLCQKFGAQLVVNDFWQMAIDEGCDYIHLGQEDLDGADMPAIRRANLRVGISTHDHDELDRALSYDPDYVALGPVYPTTLKKMKWHQQGLERVTEWKKLIGDVPLVGIGGITIQRAQGVFEAGADCLAMVSEITMNENPEAQVQAWLAATREISGQTSGEPTREYSRENV